MEEPRWWDYLLETYKLNEQYHDSKQNAIWLGFALFYTYSIGFAMYLFANYHSDKEIYPFVTFIIADTIINLLSMNFLKKQTQCKCNSVFLSAKMKKLFVNYDQDTAKKWLLLESKEQAHQVTEEHNENARETKAMERPLFIIAIIMIMLKLVAYFHILKGIEYGYIYTGLLIIIAGGVFLIAMVILILSY